MAEQYLDPTTGEQHSSFADQMLSHSTSVVAAPSSYYINASQADAVSSNVPSVDYIENPSYEQQTFQNTINIPLRSADITNISNSLPGSGNHFTPLAEAARQQAFYNTGSTGQPLFSEDPNERFPRGEAAESMEALTRSAFELLQGVVAQASNSCDATPRSSNQLVSLLPTPQSHTSRDVLVTEANSSAHQNSLNAWSASNGTTVVVDAHDSMLRTSTSGVSTLPQEQAIRAGNGGTANPKVIRIVSQKPYPASVSTAKPSNGQHNYRCVLVKDSDGTQKNCIVLKPNTSAAVGGEVTSRQKTTTSSTRATAAMKLAHSVEQEISDMIRETSANFTIKGDDAKKSGLLEKTVDVSVSHSNINARLFCLICKEMYSQKEGFQYHLQRISFVLKYKCIKCATVFTFFNKCALWMHLNGHQEDIDYQRVLRLDPYDFISNPDVFNANMTASVASDSKKLMNKFMIHTQGIVKCPVCQEFVRNLPIHLKRPDGKYHAHVCQICEMYLPNKCSLIAHEKLHRGGGNQLCCPECGLTKEELNSSIKDMFDHVDTCMHFNRAEAYSCECKASFPSLAEAKKHFLDCHIKPLSKCSSCSVAFTDPRLLASHVERYPRCKSLTAQRTTCLCTLCKSIMSSPIEAKLHLQKHISKEAELSWMCFLCSMMFSTANELRIHCEEDHPHKAKRCTICFKLFCNRQLLVDHIIKKSCNLNGQHSLGRCADMPPKAVTDIDFVVKNLFQDGQKSFAGPASQRSPGRSHHSSSSNAASLLSEQQADAGSSQQPGPPQAVDQDLETLSADQANTSSTAARQKSKVAVRRPASLDNTTTALLDEIRRWKAMDGKEILPTTTPPSKKRGRPKKEKRPPHHLVCGVTAKGISYQCHPCKIIVTGTNNYITHMKYHEAKGDCTYGAFCHCSVCDKLIGSHLIMKHLKDHQDKGVIVCCRCQRRDFGDLEDAIQHAHNLCEYRKIGSGAGSVQTENFSIENRNPSAMTISRQPQNSFTESYTESEHVTEEVPIRKAAAPQAKSKLHPCHLCGLIFENVILRDQHVRKVHGGTRKIFHCLACEKKKIVKTFTSQITARKHVTNKHRVVQRSLVDRCLKEVNASVTSNTNQTEVPSPEQEEEVVTEGPAPKRLRLAGEGDFLCGKCGFSCAGDDKASFSEHIETHNTDKEPQCPECGLCYTVLTAVKRHLFAVHKIKNIEDYLTENGIVEEQEEEDDEFDSVLEEMLPGVRPLPPVTRQQQAPAVKVRKEQVDDDLDSLECNVCYRSFDTEANLKTHMRTHGMAFIRSKRFKPI